MRLIVALGAPQTHALHPGTVLLGRSPENHICILHESVSRLHAQIEVAEGRATLVDRKSTRGTFVNGQRVSRYDLRGGEVIHLGEVACTFAMDGATPAAPIPPTVIDLGGTVLSGAAAPLLTRGIDGRATLAQVSDVRRGGRLTAEQKLRTLLQVSQILSGPEPIDALLTKILDLVFQILGVNRAVLLLADEATGELVPRVARPEGDLHRYSRSVVQYARDHNAAALFSDAARDERLQAAQSVLLMSLQSAMAAPLRARDRLLGVLYLDSTTTGNAYLEDDLDLVAAFASQAAIALENAQLYRKIEQAAVLRSRFERFFPPATAREIAASGEPLATVDTEVTALFADITGYTAMVSEMAPREVVALLNEYFAEVSAVVLRHEGVIEKYIGDALLAVWGAPRPRPDDAQRALRCAVEMLRALIPFNERRASRGLPPLQIHIGVNTGPVAAGNIGSEDYLQYATIGDTTNVTSRICSAAGPDEILASEATLRRAGPLPFPCEALAPVAVKGKHEPLRLHRILWRG
jgi:adenylate cyclase